MGNLFKPGPTITNTSNTQSGTQSGSTESNAWDQLGLAGLFGNFNSAFTPQGPNQYQTGAANTQLGLASSALNPAFNAANAGASGSLYNSSSYQPYMSQYTQQVIDPTIEAFKNLNAATTSDINGSLAKNGAFGNSNNAATRANVLAPILNQQKVTLGNLNQAGFNQANANAQAAAGFGLQGAQTAAGLTNAGSNATNALFNQGQQLWQNPFAQFSQVSSALSPWTQASGQNYSGVSSGTSNGTSSTQANPSWLEQLAPIFGAGAKAYGAYQNKKDGGGVMPMSMTGGLGGFKSGGGVDAGDFAGKVEKAFHSFHRMRKHSETGGRHGYATDGWVPEVTTAGEQDIIDQANSADSSKYWNKVGDAFGEMPKPANPAGGQPGAGQNNDLSRIIAQADPRQHLKALGYAGGGDVGRHGYATDGYVVDNDQAAAPPPDPLAAIAPNPFTSFARPEGVDATVAPPPSLGAASSGSATPASHLGALDRPLPPAPANTKSYWDRLADTMNGTNETGWSGAGSALWAMNPVTARAVQSIRESQKNALAQMHADTLRGQLTGDIFDPRTGQFVKTIAGQKLPAEIAALNADSESSKIYQSAINAENKSYQSRLDNYNLRQTLLRPSSPSYREDMQRIMEDREQAQLTHDQTLARLHAQRSSGVQPPVIEDIADLKRKQAPQQ